MRRAREAQGYTAVEVLAAITLFAIGAAGVMAFQHAAITSNADARHIDVGSGIARAWIERLRRDATMWSMVNSDGGAPAAGTKGSFNNALALKAALAKHGDTSLAGWADATQYQPASRSGGVSAPDGKSGAFDTLGRDLAVDENNYAFYCVQFRGDWLGTSVPASDNDLARVEVRVFWPREAATMPIPAGAAGCNNLARNAARSVDATKMYSFVYAVSTVRVNAAR